MKQKNNQNDFFTGRIIIVIEKGMPKTLIIENGLKSKKTNVKKSELRRLGINMEETKGRKYINDEYY